MRSYRLASVVALGVGSLVGCDATDSSGDDDGGASGSSGSSGSAGSGGTTATGGNGASGGSTSGAGGTGGSAGVSGSSAGGTSGSGTAGTGGTGAAGGTGGSSAGAGGASQAGTSSAGTESGGSAGSAGSTSNDPCSSALFCDDFESHAGPAPAGMWAARTTSATVTIDTTQAVSGSKSVKFATQAGDRATAFIRLSSATVFPPPDNAFYGRMMFRLESAPTDSVHWTFIQGTGTVPGQTYHAQYRYGGQQPVNGGNQLMANYETPDWYSDSSTPGSDCWLHSNGTVVPVGVWSCIEWKFESDQMHFWLDGEPVEDLTMTGTGQGCVNNDATFPWTAPTFEMLDLGWESFQTDAARTAWVDDVVLSTTRVGCPVAM